MYLLNSFRYVKTPHPHCTDGTVYWDERNRKMARNIADQVVNHPFQRSIVIVGAGHVISLKKELEENYPGLTVRLMH